MRAGPQSSSTAPAEETAATDAPSEPAAAEPVPVTDVAPAAVKPELATFRLKRGKASASKPAFKPRDHKKKAEGGKDAKPRHDKPKKPRKGDKKPGPREERERVYSAAPKTVEDSPFAILQQLKTGSKE